jgi:hypothetical protein
MADPDYFFFGLRFARAEAATFRAAAGRGFGAAAASAPGGVSGFRRGVRFFGTGAAAAASAAWRASSVISVVTG